jgi:hypothetical protein
MVKRIWKDRKGVIAPITAVLAVVLVVALVGVAYIALADDDGWFSTKKDPQPGKKEIIGYFSINAEVRSTNLLSSPARFTISDADVKFIRDSPPSASFIDSLYWGGGDKDLKMTCMLEYPALSHVIDCGDPQEWNHPITTGISDGTNDLYRDKMFTSGGIKETGNYVVTLTLYKDDGDGGWTQVDEKIVQVSI